MFVEIAYTGRRNHAPDTYKAYKNRVDDYVLSDSPTAKKVCLHTFSLPCYQANS